MHRLAKQIEGIHFDWYIAIARGGLVPTALLSQITGQRNIDTFCIKRYGENNQEIAISNIVDKNLSHLKHKSLLLIDDIVDHGKTIDFVKNYVKIYQPKEVKVACLYWKERSIVKPDFFISLCSNETWIEFPWEKSQSFVLPKYCVVPVSNETD